MPWTRAIPSLWLRRQLCVLCALAAMARGGVPNRKHTSGLGEAVLLLHAADPLLEDRRHLGGRGLCIGGVGPGEGGRGAGLVAEKIRQFSARQRGGPAPANAAGPPDASAKLLGGANGMETAVRGLQAMARQAAGAMAGGCDGLTDAILLEAEIAATRRLLWRMALENMVRCSRGY